MRYEWLTGWGLTGWGLMLAIGTVAGCDQRTVAPKLQSAPPASVSSTFDLSSPTISTPELAADEIEPGDHSEPEPASAEFDPTLLIEQSAALTRLLLAGDASAAHEKFALPYRELVTIQTLRDLSKQLSELFGHDISEITFLQTQFGTIDVRTQTESIQVSHVIDFAGGKQAISTVSFFLSAGDGNAEEGELSAIDVRETWPSFSPSTLQTVKESLQILFTKEALPEDETRRRSWQADARARYLGLLHPEMHPLIPDQQLDDCIEQIARCFGPMRETPHWSKWSYRANGQQLSALGTLVTELDQVEVRADFSQEKLIGLTFIGQKCAFSTLDLLEDQSQLAGVGKRFWEHVFRGEVEKAHGLLAPKFQEELPLEEFQSAIDESGLPDSPELKEVELDLIRFSNRVERTPAVGLAAYYSVTFIDGSQQAVQCEFGLENDTHGLLFFANDFEAVIPRVKTESVLSVVDAFLSNEPVQVERLLNVGGQKSFDAGISRAFMQHLRKLLGSEQPTVEDICLLYFYSQSNRLEQMRARIVTPNCSIPFQATTQRGSLTSFNFSAPELESFASALVEIVGVEDLGIEFLRQWMKAGETEQAVFKMVGSEDRQELLANLKAQRDSLLGQHGHFLWSDLVSWKISENKNEIQAIYELEFAEQTIDMQLTFEVNAIGAKIRSANILAETR